MINIQNNDPEVSIILNNEYNRQKNGIELIASENFVSDSILHLLASFDSLNLRKLVRFSLSLILILRLIFYS